MSKNVAEITQKAWVKALLNEPVLARIGTCNPRTMQPHVVPVWFEWDGECLWVSAFSSTRKVKDLHKNPMISVLIDVDRPGETARAVLLEGRAELITDPATVQQMATRLYTRYMGPEGVLAADPQSWIVDPENTMIKLTPTRAFAWGISD
jgi:PPOX class probable F420-dependent enzyme